MIKLGRRGGEFGRMISIENAGLPARTSVVLGGMLWLSRGQLIFGARLEHGYSKDGVRVPSPTQRQRMDGRKVPNLKHSMSVMALHGSLASNSKYSQLVSICVLCYQHQYS